MQNWQKDGKLSLYPVYRPAPSQYKTVALSGVSAGTQLVQTNSATAGKALQINGSVIAWSNVVSCLARIINNDNWRQMSVKRIRLHIKAKRKIHDNLGHKEHSTHSPHPHSIFFTIPHIITPPIKKEPNIYKPSHTHTDIWNKKGRNLYCK